MRNLFFSITVWLGLTVMEKQMRLADIDPVLCAGQDQEQTLKDKISETIENLKKYLAGEQDSFSQEGDHLYVQHHYQEDKACSNPRPTLFTAQELKKRIQEGNKILDYLYEKKEDVETPILIISTGANISLDEICTLCNRIFPDISDSNILFCAQGNFQPENAAQNIEVVLYNGNQLLKALPDNSEKRVQHSHQELEGKAGGSEEIVTLQKEIIAAQKETIAAQKRMISEQQKTIASQRKKIAEQEETIERLSKRKRRKQVSTEATVHYHYETDGGSSPTVFTERLLKTPRKAAHEGSVAALVPGIELPEDFQI